ncbi:hypothetical protein [Streptomyces sp. NPDC046909]|uniref:Rv1733c family protein n=1 Tax=Streptomyces sp. NPDC046909 TaxID=3155617 RepID=UPI0033F27CEF
MHTHRRTKKRLWRWRSNPLRRHTDVVEAWIVLAVWVAVVVGGTLAGLVTAHAADEVFARQRAERHPVQAVLLTDVPAATALGGTKGRLSAKVRWTASDGSVRSGKTLVDTGQKAGSKVVVWTDRQGKLTTEPPSPAAAMAEAGILGLAAALALAGVVTGTGAVARYRLGRQRLDEWGREWDLVEPRWGHRTG